MLNLLLFAGLVDGIPHRIMIDVAIGELHSLALTTDGIIFSWGANDCGQLGRDTSAISAATAGWVLSCLLELGFVAL